MGGIKIKKDSPFNVRGIYLNRDFHVLVDAPQITMIFTTKCILIFNIKKEYLNIFGAKTIFVGLILSC